MIAGCGVSYIDSTGNMRLQSDKPALYILTTGADKDPWPDDQPLKSLRGRGAAGALRAIVDFRPPYGVRELAGRANVSPATLARVVDLLARDALLTRDARGRVNDVDWDGCLRLWSKDYDFATSNQTTAFLAPRGLNDLTTKLATVKWRYPLPCSLAAQSFSPIAPARLGTLYVDDVEAAVRQLDLREVDSRHQGHHHPAGSIGALPQLFLVAAAVVCDTGAMQSHAAIVARELGIPAVMSVADVTAIADGTWLEVDGNTGTIQVC